MADASVRCEWFVLCEDFEIDDQARITLTHIYSRVEAVSWPAVLPDSYLAARVLGTAGTVLRVILHLRLPSGRPYVVWPTFNVTIEPSGAALVVVDLEEISLPDPGEYRALLLIDGVQMASTSVAVWPPEQSSTLQ